MGGSFITGYWPLSFNSCHLLREWRESSMLISPSPEQAMQTVVASGRPIHLLLSDVLEGMSGRQLAAGSFASRDHDVKRAARLNRAVRVRAAARARTGMDFPGKLRIQGAWKGRSGLPAADKDPHLARHPERRRARVRRLSLQDAVSNRSGNRDQTALSERQPRNVLPAKSSSASPGMASIGAKTATDLYFEFAQDC